MLLLPFAAVAQSDFETSQHNFKFQYKDFTSEVRQMTRKRKDHIQIGYNWRGFNPEYRYADASNTENRFRVTHKLYGNKHICINPRMEYRLFEKGDSHFRFRLKTTIKYDIQRFSLFVEFQPGWNLNRSEIDTQTRAGFYYKLNDRLKFGPFIQINTDKDFNRKTSWFGTNMSVSF